MDSPIPIEKVYRAVGKGSRNSVYVLAKNKIEYIAKSSSLVKDYRHIVTNELVAAALAKRIGLAILDYRVLTLGKNLYFGSQWMDDSDFHPIITKDLFERCRNAQMAYGMVVFDTWICNLDRHQGNLLVRCGGERFGGGGGGDSCQAESHTMLLNDHSECLMPDSKDGSYFAARLSKVTPQECVHVPFVRNAIISAANLSQAIQAAESVSDTEIAAIVQMVPEELLADNERVAWVEFLALRRNALRKLFNDNRGFFTFLNKGAI